MNTPRGRCIQITDFSMTLLNESGIERYVLERAHPEIQIGDIVEDLKVLTQQISPKAKLTDRILNPRRLKAMRVRSQVEQLIREYFFKQDFHEVRTPLLVKSPGMEAHIDPFQLSKGCFLPSSPEFAMKKLLVGGLEKIFQICHAFRDEPFSKHHRPEFMMLEFYRAFSNDQAIQDDIEKLIESIAMGIHQKTKIEYQKTQIDLTTPWPRLQVNDLFKTHLDIDLAVETTREKLRKRAEQAGVRTEKTDTWDEIYFRLWIERIEPKLPLDRAVFVTHYPASQAALSNLEVDDQGVAWAKRFEAYIGGIELCNGFDELTDSLVQRERFENEIAVRRLSGGVLSPLDEEFLAALEEGMPPSGGVALGVDRLVMLMSDEEDIEYCFWLNAYTGEEIESRQP